MTSRVLLPIWKSRLRPLDRIGHKPPKQEQVKFNTKTALIAKMRRVIQPLHRLAVISTITHIQCILYTSNFMVFLANKLDLVIKANSQNKHIQARIMSNAILSNT